MTLLLLWYSCHTFVQGSEVYRRSAVPPFLVSALNRDVDDLQGIQYGSDTFLVLLQLSNGCLNPSHGTEYTLASFEP